MWLWDYEAMLVLLFEQQLRSICDNHWKSRVLIAVILETQSRSTLGQLSTGRGTERLSFPDALWWPAQAFGSVVNLHLLLDRVRLFLTTTTTMWQGAAVAMGDSTDFSVTISHTQTDVHTTSWIRTPLMNPFGLYKSLKFSRQFRRK